MIDRIDETVKMKDLPSWLQELWEENQYIAIRAEKHYLELTEQLLLKRVRQCNEQLMATLTNRVLTIKSEPDGIVRETMINNLLIDINCG